MKSRITKLHPRLQTNKNRIAAIQNELNAITEYQLGQILDTMTDRIDAVLNANGGLTRY